MVEVISPPAALRVTQGVPAQYSLPSAASGKQIHIHFCAACGTKLYLSFERFRDIIGVYGGTFDDPNWFDRSPDKCRHIFTRSAQAGVMLPPGVNTFPAHAIQLDGTPNEPVVLTHALMISR